MQAWCNFSLTSIVLGDGIVLQIGTHDLTM